MLLRCVRPVHQLVVQSAVRDDNQPSACATCFAAASTRQLLVALSTISVGCTACAERKELVDLLRRTSGGRQAVMDVMAGTSRDIDVAPRQSMHETLEGWWAKQGHTQGVADTTASSEEQGDQQQPHVPQCVSPDDGHSTGNRDVANREAAGQWFQKAKDASDEKEAVRCCQRSLALCATDEAKTLLTHYNNTKRVLDLTGDLSRERAGQILQLQPHLAADPSAIRKAYYRVSMQLHPDRNQASNAKEAFQRVILAFEKLNS